MTKDTEILEKIVEANPEVVALFARMSYETASPKMRFPNGLRYRYFRASVEGRSRTWDCSWSTTANANYRYLSWIHELRGNVWAVTRVCEHRKRKDAKARALNLWKKRTKT
jgi:hypothetical protein